jgi:hypothetical protein
VSVTSQACLFLQSIVLLVKHVVFLLKLLDVVFHVSVDFSPLVFLFASLVVLLVHKDLHLLTLSVNLLLLLLKVGFESPVFVFESVHVWTCTLLSGESINLVVQELDLISEHAVFLFVSIVFFPQKNLNLALLVVYILASYFIDSVL